MFFIKKIFYFFLILYTGLVLSYTLPVIFGIDSLEHTGSLVIVLGTIALSFWKKPERT